MFTIAAIALFGALAASAAPMEARDTETHSVQLINNCGTGTAQFLWQNGGPTGDDTVTNGPLLGGIAWVEGYQGPGGTCGSSGVNCGAVEFSLTNIGYPNDNSGDTQNAIDYTLQTQGNHVYAYEMNAAYTNGCDGQGPPGPCTGPTQSECPGAFVGTGTMDGTVYQCQANNIGIVITFC